MNQSPRSMLRIIIVFAFSALFLPQSYGQTPTAEQLLSFKPAQASLTDVATPTGAEATACRVEALNGKQSGWCAYDGNNQIIRIILDTDGDQNLDQRRFYKDGVEVYRDIDTNNDNTPEEYRWFMTGGSRWGVDTNNDQRIDTWKVLSPEESAAEAFNALKNGDSFRFASVLLNHEDLKNLNISDEHRQKLAELVEQAKKDFKAAIAHPTVAKTAQFFQFNGEKPSSIPSGNGDFVVYENITSFAHDGDHDIQVVHGTLVQCGSVWKCVFCPVLLAPNTVSPITAVFLPGGANEAAIVQANQGAGNPQLQQEAIAELDRIDTLLAQATSPAQKTPLHKQRAAMADKLAKSSTGDDQVMWYRQLADGISMGTQLNELPEGPQMLQQYAEQFKAAGNVDMAAYFTFRQLMSNYYLNMSAPNADWARIQLDWNSSLEKFITDYPTAPDTAEALFQLANTKEYSGQEADAAKYYQQILTTFPNAAQATKSKGALFRINSVGKPMTLAGMTIDGKKLDLASYKNYIVLLHYWTSNTPNAGVEFDTLKQIHQKYSKSRFHIIGINLDGNAEIMNQFLQSKGTAWYQIDGQGPEGPQANQMGIVSVPTMILIDQNGNVVNRNVQLNTLESNLQILINPPKAP